MVPIVSKRSILVLSLGLVIGILIGLGYWYISPIEFNPGWPPVKGLTESPPPVYSSQVVIEPAAKGAEFVSTKTLQRRAEYWAFRIGTISFREYLSNSLQEELPDYYYPPEELEKMLVIKVRYGDGIARVELQVEAPTVEETQFLSGIIPELFRDFLVSEEQALRTKEYEDQLLEMETVKVELADARKELALMTHSEESTYPDLDAYYIETQAMATALEAELDTLAGTMASFIAQDLAEGEEYQDVVSQVVRVSSELAKARNKLADLDIQIGALSSDPDTAELSAKVGALTRELNNVSAFLVRVPSNVEIAEEVRSQFTAYDPTPVVEVPIDKIRGRNAVMMGAVLGIGGAWVGLNRRMLLDQLRSFGGNGVEAEDEEGEDMEVED